MTAKSLEESIRLKQDVIYEIAKIAPEMPAVNLAILNMLPVDLILMILEQVKKNARQI